MNGEKRNILNDYLAANSSEEWKLLNKAHRIINNKRQEDNKNNKELLNSLTLCSLELINVELSTDRKKTY